MSHFLLELEVILTQQPVFKISLPVILDEDSYEQKRNFRRALDNCKYGYVDWSDSHEVGRGFTSRIKMIDAAGFRPRTSQPKYLLGEFSLVEEFLNRVESLIEENIDSPKGITYGTITGQDLFYQVSVRGMQ